MQIGEVALLLDPGMGKTSIALMAFKLLKQQGIVNNALVITPLRPMYLTWPNEIKKWEDFHGLTVSIIHGREKEEALRRKADIYLINPEGVTWLASQKKLPEFDVLIVDESTKFKNTNTQRFKALRSMLSSFARRWILTGTPVPNGLMDLFGQIYILDQGASLGRYITHYRNRWFYQAGDYDWRPRQNAVEEISDVISPFCIRLKAEDYLQMPKMVQANFEFDLPPKVREIYDKVEEDFYVAVNDFEIVAKNTAAAGTKLRQVANGAVYVYEQDMVSRSYQTLHKEKIELLADLIEELQGKSVIVVYEFEHDKSRIREAFPDAKVATGITAAELQRIEHRFNTGQLQILLMHAGSAAGLNLQANCHHVIWFGLPWNLEHYIQTNDRVYRQGQANDIVYIYHIVARHTKDAAVAKALTKKDLNQETLLKILESKSHV